tara:strand:+ start:18011 stop:18889 length:879 start_codon:yes stop_codon:yes gene_type:complete
MNKRKGIILAGGIGTRLYPLTLGVSKQLMPIYDKPMIYYPLSILMLSGIREIAIINTPDERAQFEKVLGDGSQWGVSFRFIEQPSPDGLAQAYIISEEFLDGSDSVMVLGDNIFYGDGLISLLEKARDEHLGGTIFGYQVTDPERYGVIEFGKNQQVISIKEKPSKPSSNFAVTGLYFLDKTAPERAKRVKPSKRGELEIVDLLESYLSEASLSVELMSRGYAWLDTGTHESLLEASEFVKSLQTRQGLMIGCPEEIAFKKGWITNEELKERAELFSSNYYGNYLLKLLEQD